MTPPTRRRSLRFAVRLAVIGTLLVGITSTVQLHRAGPAHAGLVGVDFVSDANFACASYGHSGPDLPPTDTPSPLHCFPDWDLLQAYVHLQEGAYVYERLFSTRHYQFGRDPVKHPWGCYYHIPPADEWFSVCHILVLISRHGPHVCRSAWYPHNHRVFMVMPPGWDNHIKSVQQVDFSCHTGNIFTHTNLYTDGGHAIRWNCNLRHHLHRCEDLYRRPERAGSKRRPGPFYNTTSSMQFGP